jgi:hypothetical protein
MVYRASLQPPTGHNTANRSPMAGHIQAMHRTLFDASSVPAVGCVVRRITALWNCNVMKKRAISYYIYRMLRQFAAPPWRTSRAPAGCWVRRASASGRQVCGMHYGRCIK